MCESASVKNCQAAKPQSEHSGPKTLESGMEQKLRPEFLRNLQPRAPHRIHITSGEAALN
jgi:hypothetical protein